MTTTNSFGDFTGEVDPELAGEFLGEPSVHTSGEIEATVRLGELFDLDSLDLDR